MEGGLAYGTGFVHELGPADDTAVAHEAPYYQSLGDQDLADAFAGNPERSGYIRLSGAGLELLDG